MRALRVVIAATGFPEIRGLGTGSEGLDRREREDINAAHGWAQWFSSYKCNISQRMLHVDELWKKIGEIQEDAKKGHEADILMPRAGYLAYS
ncbi:hypothetical protein JCM14713_14800 [Desulfomicrobium salsuginis]